MIHDRTPEPEERRLLHELDNAEKRIRELEEELAKGLLLNDAMKLVMEKAEARVAELERKFERRLTIPPDMTRKFEEVEALRAREREGRQ